MLFGWRSNSKWLLLVPDELTNLSRETHEPLHIGDPQLIVVQAHDSQNNAAPMILASMQSDRNDLPANLTGFPSQLLAETGIL